MQKANKNDKQKANRESDSSFYLSLQRNLTSFHMTACILFIHKVLERCLLFVVCLVLQEGFRWCFGVGRCRCSQQRSFFDNLTSDEVDVKELSLGGCGKMTIRGFLHLSCCLNLTERSLALAPLLKKIR
jgi:hypothetical protein